MNFLWGLRNTNDIHDIGFVDAQTTDNRRNSV